jgi:putative transposase
VRPGLCLKAGLLFSFMLHAPRHHPPHFLEDNTIYFVTARTVDQAPYFNSNSKAGLLKFQIALYAWVLLNNHYHLLFKIKKGEDLSKFINFLNGKSSFELNKSENTIGRKIWYQYWDHSIRDETDFWQHFNYIHNNPVKHSLQEFSPGIRLSLFKRQKLG